MLYIIYLVTVVLQPWYMCFGKGETSVWTQGCLTPRDEISLSWPVVKGLSRPQILKQYFLSFFILDDNFNLENIGALIKYLHREMHYTLINSHCTIKLKKNVFKNSTK